MDKETLSHYGWIVVLVLILSVMIALATPFGEYVKVSATNTLTSFIDTNQGALSIVDPPSSFTNPNKFNYPTAIKTPTYFAEDYDDMTVSLFTYLSEYSYANGDHSEGSRYAQVAEQYKNNPSYRESIIPNQIVTFKTDLLNNKIYEDKIYANLYYKNGTNKLIELTREGTDEEVEFNEHLFVNLNMSELSLPSDNSNLKAIVTTTVDDISKEYELFYINEDGIDGWVFNNDQDMAIMVVKNARTELDEDGYAGDIIIEEGSAIVAVMGAVGGTLPIHKLTVAGKEFVVNEKPAVDEDSNIKEGVWSYTGTINGKKQILSLYYNVSKDDSSYVKSEGTSSFVWEYTGDNNDATGTLVDGLDKIQILNTEFEKVFTQTTKSAITGWIFSPKVLNIFHITPFYTNRNNVSKILLSFDDSSQITVNDFEYISDKVPNGVSGFFTKEYGSSETGNVYSVTLGTDGAMTIIADNSAPKLLYITFYETVNGKTIENTFQMITPAEAENLIEVPLGVGKTHYSFVNEMYYSDTKTVEVYSNGSYSDGLMQNWSEPGAQAPNFNGCLLQYSDATTIIFKEGVTKIGGNTEWNDNITDIYLPRTMKTFPTSTRHPLQLPKSCTYHVYADSAAETYLSENGYTYVLIN